MKTREMKLKLTYYGIARGVRKEDHNELLRMLTLASNKQEFSNLRGWSSRPSTILICAFGWSGSPQGTDYWSELYNRLRDAGY